MAADDRQNTETPGRAVVDVRISDDPDRLERGVECQEEDCRAFADRLGLDVVQVLRENDTPACSRTRRLPNSLNMLADPARTKLNCTQSNATGPTGRLTVAVRATIGQ
jgi:hypothetical protein